MRVLTVAFLAMMASSVQGLKVFNNVQGKLQEHPNEVQAPRDRVLRMKKKKSSSATGKGGKGKGAAAAEPEALTCYSDEEVLFLTDLLTTDDTDESSQVLATGALDFGTVDVLEGGGDIMIDVFASTGGFMQGLTVGGDYPNDFITNEYQVLMVVSVQDTTTGQSFSPLPSSSLALNQMDHESYTQQDDWDTDDRWGYVVERKLATAGRFLVPDLPAGSYAIMITFEMEALVAIDDNSGDSESQSGVILGPHVITAQAIKSTNQRCNTVYTSDVTTTTP